MFLTHSAALQASATSATEQFHSWKESMVASNSAERLSAFSDEDW
jgi:hypothetical protein